MADNNYEDLFNSDVVDVNGNRIGAIGQVYLDDLTGQPSWVTVKTGWFGLKETFVPLEQAIVAAGTITVPYTAEKVKDAPRVDPDKHLDAKEEAHLYSYYGIATILASDLPAGDEEVARTAEAESGQAAQTGAEAGTETASPVAQEPASFDPADETLLSPAEDESPEEAAAPEMDHSIDPQVAPILDDDAVVEIVVEESTGSRPDVADLYDDVRDPQE